MAMSMLKDKEDHGIDGNNLFSSYAEKKCQIARYIDGLTQDCGSSIPKALVYNHIELSHPFVRLWQRSGREEVTMIKSMYVNEKNPRGWKLG